MLNHKNVNFLQIDKILIIILKENLRLKNKKIVLVIAAIVVVIISAVSIYSLKSDHKTAPQWIVSGPFAISKSQYKLGENVFLTVNGLKPSEAGNITIARPSGDIYLRIPFNGTLKEGFNQYFKPDLKKALDITNKDELVGKWYVVFDGVNYPPLGFEITNEFLPGMEQYYNATITNSTS